jgi:hypothetical protein
MRSTSFVCHNLIVVAFANLEEELDLMVVVEIVVNYLPNCLRTKGLLMSVERRNVLPTNSSGIKRGNLRSDGSVSKLAISSVDDWRIVLSVISSPSGL